MSFKNLIFYFILLIFICTNTPKSGIMIYKRNCPNCDKEIEYKWKRTYERAVEKNTKCSKCTGKKISEALVGRDTSSHKSYKDIPIVTKMNENGDRVYVRNCPSCDEEIIHKNKRSYKWAIRDENLCRKCSAEKTSQTLKEKYKNGEITPNIRNSEKEKKLERPYKRDCPECGGEMSYTRKDIRNSAEKNGNICNSCSAYKYNKTFNDIITEEHIKQMRASKAGFDTWEEYVEKYPKKQMYKREVWKYTYKNDLESLDNWEKRGRCGVEGAYQLDHIISINEGYEKNISAEKIGSMNNLRMIPWEENRRKGAKINLEIK